MSDDLKPNPHRVVQLTVANEATDKALGVPQPAAGAVLPQWAVVGLTALVAVAGVLLVIPTLPPTVHAIAGGVIALGTAFGIASPGIRRKGE